MLTILIIIIKITIIKKKIIKIKKKLKRKMILNLKK
jgi:hypothetical protein